MVDFTLEEPKDGGLSYSPVQLGLPSSLALQKAARIDIALGEDSPGQETISEKLQYDASEEPYREILYNKKVTRLEQARYDLLNSVARQTFYTDQEKTQGKELFQSFSLVDPQKALENPEIVLEQTYAETVTDFVDAVNDKDPSDPVMERLRELNSDYVTRQAILDDLIIEYTEADREAGILNDTYDFLQEWIPLRSAALIMNEVPAFEAEGIGKVLPGENLEQQIAYLYGLPKEQFKSTVREVAAVLRESSLDASQKFLMSVKNYTYSDKVYDNLITAFDVLDVTGLGGAAVKSLAKGTKSYGKAVTKALSIPNGKPIQNLAEETGNSAGANAARLDKVFDDTLSPETKGFDEIADTAIGVFNPHRLLTGQTTLNAKSYNRVADNFLNRGKDAFENILSGPTVQRQTGLELMESVRATQEQLRKDFTYVSKNIIDISEEAIASKVSNVSTLSIRLGSKNGDMFSSEQGAKNFAEKFIKLRTDDYEIKPQGDKWFIEVRRTVDESKGFSRGLREASIQTNQTKEYGLVETILNSVRTPADVLSEQDMQARLLALHGEQGLRDMFSELVRPINKLKKTEYSELNTMLKKMRDDYDPVTKSRGFYYQNTGEFEIGFHGVHGKFPTEAQVEGFLAYRQAMDYEYMVRNLGRYRDISRVGGKDVEFNLAFKDKKGKFKTQKVAGLGKEVDRIPLDDPRDFNVAIVKPDGSTIVKPKKFLREEERALIREMEEKGSEIVKAIESPFRINDNVAHFVITDGLIKKNRISLKQLSYNPGAHVIDKYPIYVKQPSLVGKEVKYYTGDNTLVNAFTEKQAKEIARDMEDARKAFAMGNEDIWGRIVDEKLPFLTRDSFVELFTKTFNKDVPFVATRAGLRSIDVQKIDNVVDSVTNNLDELGALDRRFSQTRSNTNYKILREEESGSYIVDSAPKIDPLEALSEGVNSAVSNKLQKDYIVKNMESYLKTFGSIVDGSVDDIWANPLDFLHNPKYIAGASDNMRRQAEVVRKSILRQVSNATPESKYLIALRDKISESFRAGSKSFEMAEDWLLPVVQDPFVYARSVAFNLKLGFFNVLQIPLQAQTLTHLLALAPKEAFPSITAAWSMQALRMTSKKNIHKHFGEALSRAHDGSGGFGRMTAQQFEESYAALRRSGWDRVGNDIAQLDDAVQSNLFRNGKTQKLVDTGRVFFDGVERFLRIAGWNASYLQWRKANPTKALDDISISQILQKADDFTVNMSSANNAVWQKGVFGVPLQFASYQIRLMEQMLPSLIYPVGKRLGQKPPRIPPQAAARAFATYSAMYGVGFGGISATVGGLWPVGDYIREEAVKRGVDINDNYISEAFFDGIPSVLFEILTGYDFDFGQRYGPSGIDVFKDLWDGEVSVAELAFGPSGSVAKSLFDLSTNLAMSAYWATMDDNDVDIYPVLASDLLDVAREASIVNTAYGAYAAFNHGTWLTRTNREVANVDEIEGFIARTLGVTPSEINYAYVKNNILRKESAARSEFSKLAIKYYKKGDASEDYETRRGFYARAKAALVSGGFTETEKIRIRIESQLATPYVDSVQEKFKKDAQRRNKERE